MRKARCPLCCHKCLSVHSRGMGSPQGRTPALTPCIPGPSPPRTPFSPCLARTRPLSQCTHLGCTPIIPIPPCPSPFSPNLRESLWLPLIFPLTRFRLTHTHHKCYLENV